MVRHPEIRTFRNALKGHRRVYLPEFTVALVRTPYLSPLYAQFRVPLNFNKLDLRSYLLKAYNVPVRAVRSYVEQQPVTRLTRDNRNFGPWRRPKSIKRMTVELHTPFVWPEEPKDLSGWEKESWDAGEKWQHKMREKQKQKPDFSEEPDEDMRKAYEEQAKELVEGKQTWRPTWQALGLDFAHKELINNKATNPPKPKWMTKPRKP